MFFNIKNPPRPPSPGVSLYLTGSDHLPYAVVEHAQKAHVVTEIVGHVAVEAHGVVEGQRRYLVAKDGGRAAFVNHLVDRGKVVLYPPVRSCLFHDICPPRIRFSFSSRCQRTPRQGSRRGKRSPGPSARRGSL